jgi:phosphoglucomutase
MQHTPFRRLVIPHHPIYAESFRGADHLRRILEEAQTIAGDALAAAPQQPGMPSQPKLKEKL